MSTNCWLCISHYVLIVSAPFGLNGYQFRCVHLHNRTVWEISPSFNVKLISTAVVLTLLGILLYDCYLMHVNFKNYPILIFMSNMAETLITSNTVLMMLILNNKKSNMKFYQGIMMLLDEMKFHKLGVIFPKSYIRFVRRITKLLFILFFVLFTTYTFHLIRVSDLLTILKQMTYTICFLIHIIIMMRFKIETNNFHKMFHVINAQIRHELTMKLMSNNNRLPVACNLRRLVRFYRAIYFNVILCNKLINPNLILWFIAMTVAVVLNLYVIVQFMIDKEWDVLTHDHLIVICRIYVVMLTMMMILLSVERVAKAVSRFLFIIS